MNVTQQIENVVSDCSEKGWDGYNALPVSSESAAFAISLIGMMPRALALPSTGADPDGSICLDWSNMRRDCLSVSVSPAGTIAWASLIGGINGESKSGTILHFDSFPDELAQLIPRITG